MTRRCKPGQRARIIGDSVDAGQIVLVVRHYFYPENIGDGVWGGPIFPWVVTSLGAPLASVWTKTGEERPASMTIVVDDCDLEPLPDDDDPAESIETGKPLARPTSRAAKERDHVQL